LDIFKIKHLTFTYPEQSHPALEDIDLSIKRGEVVVIFGESGSGKTTLLKMLKKALKPHGEQTGQIYYKGKPFEALDEQTSASDIGFVMQNPETQIVTDKVWHELAFGLENLGVSQQAIRRRVAEIANYFGIHRWFRESTSDLSGGQKQLLNLASTMVMYPDVLLLDEPTAQLDPIAAMRFIQTLEHLNRDLGLTIVVVEHRLDDVFPLADKTVLLQAGRIVYKGDPRRAGYYLNELDDNHPMLHALPTAMKVYDAFGGDGKSPLTVREGRNFLQKYISSDIEPIPNDSPPVESSEVVLELKNIWFRYERNGPDILAGVDLQINEGEIFAILGGNGSGKTTLLQTMAGQRRPYRGKVFLRGKNIRAYKGKELYQQNIAVLPQDPQELFLKPTVKDDYYEIAKVYRYSTDQMEALIEKIAQLLNIAQLLHKHPYDLSGGEQQKVALGKLLLLQPNILLLDEPTKGMDAWTKRTMQALIQKLKKRGMTVVIVTHDIEFAACVSNRVGFFFDHHFISIDTPRAFFSENHYYTTVARRLSRNILPNVITTRDIVDICQHKREKFYEKAMD